MELRVDDAVVDTGEKTLTLMWDSPACPADGYYMDGCYYGTWIGSASLYSITVVDPSYTFSGIIDEVCVGSTEVQCTN